MEEIMGTNKKKPEDFLLLTLEERIVLYACAAMFDVGKTVFVDFFNTWLAEDIIPMFRTSNLSPDLRSVYNWDALIIILNSLKEKGWLVHSEDRMGKINTERFKITEEYIKNNINDHTYLKEAQSRGFLL